MSFNPHDPDEQPNQVPHDVVVSVRMSTYNHGPYIRQAIESVLMQKVDFKYELCIGEDDSTDETRDICKELAISHNKIIRLFLRRAKDKIYVNGRMTGKNNGRKTIQACRGKYIAILEGDDFWIDPEKLKRQYDYLEANPADSICATQALYWKIDGSRGSYVKPGAFLKKYHLHDLLTGDGCAVNLCTVMHRRRADLNHIEWSANIAAGDWALLVEHLKRGESCAVLSTITAIYRIHPGGVCSGVKRSSLQKWELALGKLLAARPVVDEKEWRYLDSWCYFYRKLIMMYSFSSARKYYNYVIIVFNPYFWWLWFRWIMRRGLRGLSARLVR